jgi:uncharacterized damage-inducible protein DinB
MESQRIAELIERVLTGDPWHGPSVERVLENLDAATAAARPIGGTHSAWELVLHMTGWAREVTARMRGRAAQEPEAGDWPPVGEPTAERWREAQAALFATHRDLIAEVRKVDEARMARPVVDFRDNALGTGLSHYLTLHGLLHHTVYHAGQIAVVRRLVG